MTPEAAWQPTSEFDVSSLEWALPSPPKYHTFEEVPAIKVTSQLERLNANIAAAKLAASKKAKAAQETAKKPSEAYIRARYGI